MNNISSELMFVKVLTVVGRTAARFVREPIFESFYPKHRTCVPKPLSEVFDFSRPVGYLDSMALFITITPEVVNKI